MPEFIPVLDGSVDDEPISPEEQAELRRKIEAAKAKLSKHGTHDQTSHGNWARGGASGGFGSPRSSHVGVSDGTIDRSVREPLRDYIGTKHVGRAGSYIYKDVPWASLTEEEWANREQYLMESSRAAGRRFSTRYQGTQADLEGLMELPREVPYRQSFDGYTNLEQRIQRGEVSPLWDEYRYGGFDGINQTLRKAAVEGRRRVLPERINVQQADHYKEVMSKGMLTTDTGFITMRGVNQTSREYKVGMEWTNPAFTSTTLSPRVASNFASGSLQGGKPATQRSRVFMIDVSKGSKFMPISPYQGEREVVLPPDTKFKVVSHHRAYRIIRPIDTVEEGEPTPRIEYEVYDLYGVEAETP